MRRYVARFAEDRTFPGHITRDFVIEGLRRETQIQNPTTPARPVAMRRSKAERDALERELKAMGARRVDRHSCEARVSARTRDAQSYAAECREWRCTRGGKLQIEGTCSTSAIDTHGAVLHPAGMELEGLPLPLLFDHDEKKKLGEIVWLRRTAHAIFVRAVIDDHQVYAWDAIQAGELSSLSVRLDRLSHERRDADGIDHVDRWRLREISVVPQGANPEARFWIVRHPGSVRLNQQ